MIAAEAAALLVRSLRDGVAVAEVTILEGPLAGDRILVREDSVTGTFGDSALDAVAGEAGRAALLEGRPRTVPLGVDPEERPAARAFVEPHLAAPELVIVGAGHIAQPLSRIGDSLGYRVTVLDDRPAFATRDRFPNAERVIRADLSWPFAQIPLSARTHLVLVTRGHKYDYEVLATVLRGDVQPAYVGMVGSRRRVRAAFEQLVREGIPVERLAGVHAPVGLDIGAETPEEIAVSIAAELVMVRRGGGGGSLRKRDRVVARWIRAVD